MYIVLYSQNAHLKLGGNLCMEISMSLFFWTQSINDISPILIMKVRCSVSPTPSIYDSNYTLWRTVFVISWCYLLASIIAYLLHAFSLQYGLFCLYILHFIFFFCLLSSSRARPSTNSYQGLLYFAISFSFLHFLHMLFINFICTSGHN